MATARKRYYAEGFTDCAGRNWTMGYLRRYIKTFWFVLIIICNYILLRMHLAVNLNFSSFYHINITEKDGERYLEQLQRSQTSAEVISNDIDEKVLTVGK